MSTPRGTETDCDDVLEEWLSKYFVWTTTFRPLRLTWTLCFDIPVRFISATQNNRPFLKILRVCIEEGRFWNDIVFGKLWKKWENIGSKMLIGIVPVNSKRINNIFSGIIFVPSVDRIFFFKTQVSGNVCYQLMFKRNTLPNLQFFGEFCFTYIISGSK